MPASAHQLSPSAKFLVSDVNARRQQKLEGRAKSVLTHAGFQVSVAPSRKIEQPAIHILRLLEDVARPDAGGLTLLREAADAMRLSARGYHRVLRVARTLADLDGTEKVGRVHLAEALSYRALADEIRRAA